MHKSTVIPTINSITQWIRVWEAARATEKCRLRILNPHLFFCLNTHREMTNFITLPIPLSERSELKPNYHTRAKLKAFPLNGCNPSPDKWAAPLPLCYRPLFPSLHSDPSIHASTLPFSTAPRQQLRYQLDIISRTLTSIFFFTGKYLERKKTNLSEHSCYSTGLL